MGVQGEVSSDGETEGKLHIEAAYRMGHNPTSPNIPGRDDYILYPTHIPTL